MDSVKHMAVNVTFAELFSKFLETCRETVESATDGRRSLSFSSGKRYLKIYMFDKANSIYEHVDRSAWAFVDLNDGAIYRPANWNAPSKWARGNIFTIDPKAVCWTGPAYRKSGPKKKVYK